MNSDIKVLEAEPFFKREPFRTPLKFGNVVVEECVFCLVRVMVENRLGQRAEGYGGILEMDFWGFPSPAVPHPDRESAMCKVTAEYCKAVQELGGYRHPIDIFLESEDCLRKIGSDVSRDMNLTEAMPFLGALVAASPVDAALHDAFGNANGICSYDGYGPEHMSKDLGHYLGSGFAGTYISDYLKPGYEPRIPIFHLVGGLDKLRASEVDDTDPCDGIPASLTDWIEKEGVFCLKIKLRGTDIGWDLNRISEVAEIAYEIHDRRGTPRVFFSADTNEQCETPEYVRELLIRLRERHPRAYDDLLYIEQPTERDLGRHAFDMSTISSLKPVIVDESLTSLDDFDFAMSSNWSGIALKTCKCHSSDLLFMAKAARMGIPYTVQDLTNPKISLIHSVGLAARTNPILGVETNSRQFLPASSAAEAEVHRGIFSIRNGHADTSTLGRYGLGYRFQDIAVAADPWKKG